MKKTKTDDDKKNNERREEFLQIVLDFISSKHQGLATEVFLIEDLQEFLMTQAVSFSQVI